MPTAVRRLLRLPTPTPEELESWPVREDRPAKPWTLVCREAERLDRLFPGWFSRINKRKLDLTHSQWCVLGQATGSFYGSFSLVVNDSMNKGEIVAAEYIGFGGKNCPYRLAWIEEINYRLSL